MNKAIIVGNLTKDLDVRTASNNKHVVDFTLAVNESKDVCDYIDCVAWENNADNLAKYVGKGQKVLVEGRIKTNKWQDQNGQNRYKTYLRVDRIEFIASMSNNSSQVQTTHSEPKNNEFKYPKEFNQQTNLTGSDRDLVGYRDDEQKNNYIDIKSEDLPFY